MRGAVRVNDRNAGINLETANSFKKIWEGFFNYHIAIPAVLSKGVIRLAGGLETKKGSKSGNFVQKYKDRTARINMSPCRFLNQY